MATRVCVVVPAYNEAVSIAGVIGRIREHLPEALPLVVDDGSQDGTASVAEAAGATVLRLPVNLGIGGAVQAGYRLGLRSAAMYAHSCSHPNVIRAVCVAKRKGLVTVGLTGADGGRLKREVEYCVCVPSEDTPRIQEAHILVGHILCELVEERLFGDGHALSVTPG